MHRMKTKKKKRKNERERGRHLFTSLSACNLSLIMDLFFLSFFVYSVLFLSPHYHQSSDTGLPFSLSLYFTFFRSATHTFRFREFSFCNIVASWLVRRRRTDEREWARTKRRLSLMLLDDFAFAIFQLWNNHQESNRHLSSLLHVLTSTQKTFLQIRNIDKIQNSRKNKLVETTTLPQSRWAIVICESCPSVSLLDFLRVLRVFTSDADDAFELLSSSDKIYRISAEIDRCLPCRLLTSFIVSRHDACADACDRCTIDQNFAGDLLLFEEKDGWSLTFACHDEVLGSNVSSSRLIDQWRGNLPTLSLRLLFVSFEQEL